MSLGGGNRPVAVEKPKVNSKFPVDDRKKKTIVQIRFHSGDKQSIEVNLDTRVQAIHDYVKKYNRGYCRVSGVGKFDLISGFPPAPLRLDRTVEELGLEESTIIQKA